MQGSSIEINAVVIMDVSGVSSHPLDFLSATTGGSSKTFSNTISTGSGDFVADFLSARYCEKITSLGAGSLVSVQTAGVVKSCQTGADFQYLASAAGSFTMSGTRNGSQPWLEEGVSWKPLTAPEAQYTVKFDEAGRMPGALWSVSLGSQAPASSSASSFLFSATNGTYPFTLSAAGYTVNVSVVSPITVDGTNVTVNATFAPIASSCTSSAFLQQFCTHIDHVVLIVMENQAHDNYFGSYCLAQNPDCSQAARGDPPGTCVAQAGYSGTG
jgi:hypothetical protein